MEESGDARRYYIDLEGGGGSNRSVSILIAARRCRTCREADPEGSVKPSKPKPYIKKIAKQCSETSDYLLPDTPIKEAIFRVVLAGGNQPETAEEIGETLSSRWATSPYPRELSPAAIGRLLDHSQSYFIVALPEPVSEEGDESGTPEEEQASATA